jgi:hypothetical protein
VNLRIKEITYSTRDRPLLIYKVLIGRNQTETVVCDFANA